jgi:hypothetical protein
LAGSPQVLDDAAVRAALAVLVPEYKHVAPVLPAIQVLESVNNSPLGVPIASKQWHPTNEDLA